jgi:hypothetical protein
VGAFFVFMDALLDTLKRLRRVSIFKVLDAVIKKNNLSELIIELNTEKQLYDEGVDSLGFKIEPEYTSLTKRIKRGKGQPTDRVTLKDTGKMYKTWTVKLVGNTISIDANLVKDGFDLEEKYGVNIIGLTDENLQVFIEAVKKDFAKELLSQILKRAGVLQIA